MLSQGCDLPCDSGVAGSEVILEASSSLSEANCWWKGDMVCMIRMSLCVALVSGSSKRAGYNDETHLKGF